MNLNARLNKIEGIVNKTNGKIEIRLADNNGNYLEQEQDEVSNIKVIKIMCHEGLRSWGK